MLKKVKHIPISFKIIFVLAIIGTTYLIVSNMLIEREYKKNGIIKKAKIVQIIKKESEADGFPGKTNNTIIIIKYKFKHNSKVYNGEGLWIPGEFYFISKKNNTITIQYLGNNPHKNRMLKSSDGLNIVVD